MSKRTKRHIWPVALVAVLAVAGLMAALIVLASPPGTTQAQGLCDDFQRRHARGVDRRRRVSGR